MDFVKNTWDLEQEELVDEEDDGLYGEDKENEQDVEFDDDDTFSEEGM
ncbi:MAG: hypothetical protein O2794_02285 [bacterium]|nr:hypothetical protein [bacterium]